MKNNNQLQIKKSFDNVVSLGYFCSVALENQRIGYRSFSLPFDWIIISRIEDVLSLISTNFNEFLLSKNLKQENEIQKHYYYDTKYNIHFYHDFNAKDNLLDQLAKVQKKYLRRIQRFYATISKPTLFVRYCSESDVHYINEQYLSIISLLKSYNKSNDIIFICNKENLINNDKVKVFYVDKDKNDTVARKFLKKNKNISNYIYNNVNIERKIQKRNIFSAKIKSIKRKIKKLLHF